jgi:hypothetical protein
LHRAAALRGPPRRDGRYRRPRQGCDGPVAYTGVVSVEVAAPELLPVRLVMACARVLPVAGVGISMFGSPGMGATV